MKSILRSSNKKTFFTLLLFLFFKNIFSQNVGINTTGATPASTNLLEVLQPSATNNSIAIYGAHTGIVAGTGYGIWSEVTGASTTNVASYFSASGATNNYAIIVPSGGGRVGLGTSAPTVRLEVSGSVKVSSDVFVGVNETTGNRIVEVGTGRTGDGASALDLIGDATYTDYGARLIRGGTANGNTILYHRGTGDFIFNTNEAAAIKFQTTATDRVAILATGEVGIGTTGPQTKLDVQQADASVQLRLMNTSTSTAKYPGISIWNYNNGTAGYPVYETRNARGSSASPTAVQASDFLGYFTGRGYGTTDFQVGASIRMVAEGTYTDASSPGAIQLETTPSGAITPTTRMTISKDGGVGIGTYPDTKAALDVSSTTQGVLVPRLTKAQRDAIASPTTSLLVYVSDGTPVGFYYYTGSAWVPLVSTITNNTTSPTNLIYRGQTIMVHTADYNSGANLVWDPNGVPVSIPGATSASDGKANTTAIVAALGAGAYAAYYCDTLTAYGYTDWYLPSFDELQLLAQQALSLVGFPVSAITGYWSSTEFSAANAYNIIPVRRAITAGQYFVWAATESPTAATGASKTGNGKCRCIRKP